MKKQILLLAIVLLIAASCKKKVAEPKNTREFNIEASSYAGSYDIRIALPDNYDPQNKKYSTIYVLDGENDFSYVTERSKALSREYHKQEVLVVSIGYGRDRGVDYTPTKAKQGGGGGPEFMKFITEDLIPRVEKEVSADTTRDSRVILGHSFGGLFTVYAFTQHNGVFGNYLMLSPSIWYDNEVVLQYESDQREKIKNKKQLVFLGIGELENSGRMQAPFEAFYQIIDRHYSETKMFKNSVPGMEHTGSKNFNIEKGLHFYFQNK